MSGSQVSIEWGGFSQPPRLPLVEMLGGATPCACVCVCAGGPGARLCLFARREKEETILPR